MPRATPGKREIPDLDALRSLIELLKASGVSTFAHGDLQITFSPDAASTEPARDNLPGTFEVPDRLRGLNPNYFHPSLGAVELK